MYDLGAQTSAIGIARGKLRSLYTTHHQFRVSLGLGLQGLLIGREPAGRGRESSAGNDGRHCGSYYGGGGSGSRVAEAWRVRDVVGSGNYEVV